MCGDRGLTGGQIRALAHPIRSRIMELFSKEASRSLAPVDLIAEFGDDFESLTVSQVNYHLRHLQHLKLIPTSESR